MLLVSDEFYASIISNEYVNRIWKQTLVNPYNIKVYLLDLTSIMYLRQVPGLDSDVFWTK